MATQNNQTASFLIRFTQKIYADENGDNSVQWRSKISHVQGGDQINFSEFKEAMEFIQSKLSDLTIEATEDKTPEEQEGILRKSFDIWKKVAAEGPKLVMDAIKDPKKQVAQIQEQISHVSDEIGQRIEIDKWRNASRDDFKTVLKRLDEMSASLSSLNTKVEKLSKQSK